MERYLIFEETDYDNSGGLYDLNDMTDDISVLKNAEWLIRDLDLIDYVQVLDLHTGLYYSLKIIENTFKEDIESFIRDIINSKNGKDIHMFKK